VKGRRHAPSICTGTTKWLDSRSTRPGRLAGRRYRPVALSALNESEISTLNASRPHAVYDLRADEIARGGGLDTAHLTGFRYLIGAPNAELAAAEVHTDSEGTASLLANINYGPFVEATARALNELTSVEQVVAGSYEVRLLRFSAAAVMALWLKSDPGGTDLIYPLPPVPAPLRARQLYSVPDFLQAIRPIAETRTATQGP